MRKFGLSMLALALAAFVGGGAIGCKKDTGGTAKAPIHLSRTGLDTKPNVTQGSAETVKLSLDPDKNFTGSVSLSATQTKGDGLKATLDPENIKITKDENQDVTLTVKADKDAAPGVHTITVTATPPKGDKAVITVSFDVVKREGGAVEDPKKKKGDDGNGKGKAKPKDDE
jgi:hypothetical protein